ncbi:PAS domain-containing protein [Caenimonas aquaedulcis]|uniref:histidine kinase n=1 Tax=Caenimonas aquaedulcis TaxID=2793270 RepID=A0A931H4Q1_9BURK|nr:PAS domain-containing protein [Caenimonas aquaedulcis]MBG9388498.1 PAS domain-containing protein [Caenimonas aquaedulcis]
MRGRLSLQQRVVILMVAAILPLSALSVWLAVRETRSTRELAQSQLKFAASAIASSQDRTIESAHALLTAIAAMPELRALPASRCQAYFAELKASNPIYFNIGYFDTEGRSVCHANAAAGAIQGGDRAFFRQALTQRRFAMGEEIVGRAGGRSTIPFGLPIIEGGEVKGVAFATLNLAQATAALARLELPPRARLLVADRRGQVVMEYPPRPAQPLPRGLANADLLRAAAAMSSGTGETEDPQGDHRIFAFAPSMRVGVEGLLAVASIDGNMLAASSIASLRDELMGMALMLLLGLLGAWIFAGRAIVAPTRLVVDAVRRLEHGDLDARVPLKDTRLGGEFTRIGSAFNLMAESLQLRQADLQSELRRSQAAYVVLDQVLNSMQEALLAMDAGGGFFMYNEAARALFPLDGPLAPRAQRPLAWGLFERDKVTPYALEDLPLSRALRGESGRQLALFVRNALVPEGRMLLCSWQPVTTPEGIRGGLVVFTDVTHLERLQSEQAAQLRELRETQGKLIEAQRIGRVGNWELDLATGRLGWSDEVYVLVGREPGEFEPSIQGFEGLVHPQDRALLKPARDSALRDGQVMRVEYRVVKPDGSIAWMSEIADARRDEGGTPVWFGGVVQDVTERRIAEEAVRAREKELEEYTLQLQRAAEAAQAITSRPDLEAMLREVADQARSVIGAHMAVVSLTKGSDWSQAISSLSMSDRYGAWRDYAEPPNGEGIYAVVCETGRALRLTQAELLAHPRYRGFGAHAADHMQLRGLLAVPLTGRDGANMGLLQLSDKSDGEFSERDEYVALELAQLASIAIENARLFGEVTQLNAGLEERIAQRTAELARQELLYRTLAEQAPEVVWNTDASGERLTFLNRAWYELVGGTPQQWLGDNGRRAIHPDDREEVAANWRRSRATRQPFIGVRRLLAKDGSWHTMSYKGTPVLDDAGEVAFWVGIDADITEFKAIEQALRNSNLELEAFSYSVSHDLRAPLGAIGGFSKALALKIESQADDRARHFLARIQAGVEKMEQLIDALLLLSKVARAPLSYGALDIGALAQEAIDELQVRAPQRKVDVRIAPGLAAQGDAPLLRLVVDNLVGNAWKFTSNTPEPVIEVGRRPADGAFFVRDNGVGFDMAYAGKLFGAFQRLHTEAEFPGTGIGLATVRRILTRHQGRVWAESVPGEGTVFYFTLGESAPPQWLASPARDGGTGTWALKR